MPTDARPVRCALCGGSEPHEVADHSFDGALTVLLGASREFRRRNVVERDQEPLPALQLRACPRCGGTGLDREARVRHLVECRECGGEGWAKGAGQ